MGYGIMIVLGYLIGCSNMAFYLSKIKNVDMRGKGSGNLGASNATVLMGWKAGILVGAHDIGKAWLAVLLAKLLFPELTYVAAAAGVACVLGHIFPFYTGFQGGKGFASYLGMTIGLNWKLALVIMALVVIVTIITDYIVMGTTLTVFSVPAYLGWYEHNWIILLILLIATAVIVYKHRINYVRIVKGTEIGLRSTAKGEHRVK